MYIQPIYPKVFYGLYRDDDTLIEEFPDQHLADLAMAHLDAIADCALDPPPPAPPTIDTEPPLPWPIPGGNIHDQLLAAYYAALEALEMVERAA